MSGEMFDLKVPVPSPICEYRRIRQLFTLRRAAAPVDCVLTMTRAMTRIPSEALELVMTDGMAQMICRHSPNS